MNPNVGIITTGEDVSVYGETLQQCLRTAYRPTHQAVYNICDGSVVEVPYGVFDYLIPTLMLAFVGAFAYKILFGMRY